jgi:hypothetical protein
VEALPGSEVDELKHFLAGDGDSEAEVESDRDEGRVVEEGVVEAKTPEEAVGVSESKSPDHVDDAHAASVDEQQED